MLVTKIKTINPSIDECDLGWQKLSVRVVEDRINSESMIYDQVIMMNVILWGPKKIQKLSSISLILLICPMQLTKKLSKKQFVWFHTLSKD